MEEQVPQPEVPQEEVYVRGTHHRKPFYMEEGPCLFEHALTKEVLDKQQKRWAYIQTLHGETRRLLVKVWVWLKKPTAVWADVITGTVFLDSGDCLSSTQRRINRWGAYETKNDKNKLKTKSEFRWNSNP